MLYKSLKEKPVRVDDEKNLRKKRNLHSEYKTYIHVQEENVQNLGNI